MPTKLGQVSRRVCGALVRALVPDDLWSDAETQRRARMVAGVAAIVIAVGLIRAVTFWRADETLEIAPFLAAAILAIAVLWMVRRRGRVTRAGNLLVGALVLTATSVAAYRGGIGSPTVLALGVVPVLATLFAGTRVGVVWTLVVWAGVLALAAARAAGIDLPDRVPPEARFGIDLAAALLVPLLMLGVAATYEWTREKALAALIKAERQRAWLVEESRLLRTDRMASLGVLAAGVGHEINNPLAYVMANLDHIADELQEALPPERGEQAAEIHQVLAEIREGTERIRRIVRDLRMFSRADETDRLRPVDIRQVMDSALALVGNEIRHRATLVKDYGDVPQIAANESRLAQVLVNLLTNAVHALPVGEAASNEIQTVIRTDSRGSVSIEVRDTGPGITSEDRARIFDPFFTTKPLGQGTGLGLAICHAIVTGMGGTIAVDSELGAGTTFRVVLPAGARDSSPPEIKEPDAADVDPTRVLIIDDDAAVASSLARILASHEAVIAQGGRRAVELLEADSGFDTIFCDLMMPDVTGMEVFEAAVRTHPQLADRFVFVTGGVFTDSASDFVARTQRPCIHKPFDVSEVRRYVEDSSGRAKGHQVD